jgi:hypothetical protein
VVLRSGAALVRCFGEVFRSRAPRDAERRTGCAHGRLRQDETVGALKALRGVREVKRVVCGGCHDLKVVIAFDKAAFDETVGGLEAKFLADLGKIEGIAFIETQTYTFMSV